MRFIKWLMSLYYTQRRVHQTLFTSNYIMTIGQEADYNMIETEEGWYWLITPKSNELGSFIGLGRSFNEACQDYYKVKSIHIRIKNEQREYNEKEVRV